MLEMTNENFARLLRGLTIAVGNRKNRILLYQFLAAEIRAQAEGLGRLQVDHQLVLGRCLHRQISRLLALENAVDVTCCARRYWSRKFDPYETNPPAVV
jgi:hypothetical protein